MFGVVLWSDATEDKAVIWCEDHGDLAYYRQTGRGDKVALDVGDWVQFDVTMVRHLRYAHNPRLVAEGVFNGLAQSLADTPDSGTGQVERGGTCPVCPPPEGEVIRFSFDRRRKRRRVLAEPGWS
jgi:hypothetical protein